MERAAQPVGRYREFEILEEIGAGSFARVYKVRAPGFRRPLALKLATNTRLAPDTIKRAVREVAVLRSLTNPHVARLHKSSIGEDHFYVLMDYLEGQQLNDFHDFDAKMAVGPALKIIMQACMGLAEAHAQGVVHRDIKPANIWIQPDGTVKLLDFGLARAWGVPWAYGTNATAARTLVGTPHYCQPEQVTTDQLTPASDVYSLVTILYELLSGHGVYFEDQSVSEVVEAMGGQPISWLDAHTVRDVVPITRYSGCGGLPDRLLELLSSGLDKDPNKRPPNAGAVASILGDILHEDLGAIDAGFVRVVTGNQPPVTYRLVPGRRTIGGSDPCDIAIRGAGLAPQHVVVDWSGAPRPIQVRCIGDTRVSRNGDPVRGVVNVEPGDLFELGAATVVIADDQADRQSAE